MTSDNQNDTASPFSKVEKLNRKKMAFVLLALVAGVSFLFTGYNIYTDFVRNPVSKATFFIADVSENIGTDKGKDNDSIIAPQPPTEKTEQTKETPALSENKELIEKLEKENKTAEKTVQALKEIIDGKSPSKVLQALEQEKRTVEQKKIDEIEKLHQEKQVAEKTKQEKIKKLDTEKKQKKLPLKSVLKQELTVPKKQYVQNIREKDPQPDLIVTDLRESIADFGLIKKQLKDVIPLHIITPLPELLENTRYGKLPIKTKSGSNSPILAYSKTPDMEPQSPYISFLLSGLGKRENTTLAAINSMPSSISFSFSPYDFKIKEHVENARKMGHETLLDLPMQQGVFPDTDPGPLGLLKGLPEQENRNRLHKILAKEVAFIGLTAYPKEIFSYSSLQMKSFMADIKNRGLLYIDGNDDVNMPKFGYSIRPDIYINKNFYRAAIRQKLEKAKEIALKNGKAFVRIEAVPVALVAMQEWMSTYKPTEEKPIPEISFAPLSYYVKQMNEKK